MDRMTEADDRFELYMELSLYRKAADCAIRMKDAARLQEVSYSLLFSSHKLARRLYCIKLSNA